MIGLLLTGIVSTARRFCCGLHGHDALLHFNDGRMSLKCTSCSYESPGWDVRANDDVKQPAASEAPRVVRMPLVDARRVV